MSNLWDNASTDHEAEAHLTRLTAARLAVTPLWSFLASSESPEDYANRRALSSAQIEDAVQTVLAGDTASYIATLAALDEQLVDDYVNLYEARQAELQATAAPRYEIVDTQAPGSKSQRFNDLDRAHKMMDQAVGDPGRFHLKDRQTKEIIRRSAARREAGKSDLCPKCGEKTKTTSYGSKLVAKCNNCGWGGTKTKKAAAAPQGHRPSETCEECGAKRMAQVDTHRVACADCGHEQHYRDPNQSPGDYYRSMSAEERMGSLDPINVLASIFTADGKPPWLDDESDGPSKDGDAKDDDDDSGDDDTDKDHNDEDDDSGDDSDSDDDSKSDDDDDDDEDSKHNDNDDDDDDSDDDKDDDKDYKEGRKAGRVLAKSGSKLPVRQLRAMGSYGQGLLRGFQAAKGTLPRKTATAPMPNNPVHTFESTHQAYNRSQTDDNIRDGDVLHVPSEGVVGYMHSAWPIAVTAEHGAFHGLKNPGAGPKGEGPKVCQSCHGDGQRSGGDNCWGCGGTGHYPGDSLEKVQKWHNGWRQASAIAKQHGHALDGGNHDVGDPTLDHTASRSRLDFNPRGVRRTAAPTNPFMPNAQNPFVPGAPGEVGPNSDQPNPDDEMAMDPGTPQVPMTTGPRVKPSTNPGLKPPMMAPAPTAPMGSGISQGFSSKAQQIAIGIRETNPGVSPREAMRLATQTLKRFPAMLKSAAPITEVQGRTQAGLTAEAAKTEVYRGVKIKTKKGKEWGYTHLNIGGHDLGHRLGDEESTVKLWKGFINSAIDDDPNHDKYEDHLRPGHKGTRDPDYWQGHKCASVLKSAAPITEDLVEKAREHITHGHRKMDRTCPMCNEDLNRFPGEKPARKPTFATSQHGYPDPSEYDHEWPESKECPHCGGQAEQQGSPPNPDHYRCMDCGTDMSGDEVDNDFRSHDDRAGENRKMEGTSPHEQSYWRGSDRGMFSSKTSALEECPQCHEPASYESEVGVCANCGYQGQATGDEHGPGSDPYDPRIAG